MNIKNELLQKLNTIISLPATSFEETDKRKNKINNIKNLLQIMESIENVITKRKQRGATEADIQKYKSHLISNVWQNNSMIISHIESLN